MRRELTMGGRARVGRAGAGRGLAGCLALLALAHAAAGWWGPPTSSVNWCELDYDVTELIAECANTVSSLAILLVGLVGLVLVFRDRCLP